MRIIPDKGIDEVLISWGSAASYFNQKQNELQLCF